MCNPDFLYIEKRSTGEKELNIVVETKDVLFSIWVWTQNKEIKNNINNKFVFQVRIFILEEGF